MFAVMWSEHCSLIRPDSTCAGCPRGRARPRRTGGERRCGGRGGRDRGRHPHREPQPPRPPSSPTRAATGVGGILRTVFTMGAAPSPSWTLRFGPLDDARSRWIAEAWCRGISGYGNSVGVPTVGGEVVFGETYQDNPLVNVLCLGVPPTDRLVLARATGAGTSPCCWGPAPAGTASVGSACSPRRASPRATRPSGRACRWATPSRRSGSSRPA